MTATRSGSGASAMGRRRAVEQREHGFQLGAQVLDGLRRQRPPGLRLELSGASILLDLGPGSLDRVLLGVEQMLHQHDELDLAPLVHAIPRAVLGGIQEAKLALPVAQHVRLQIGELADFADRKELLHRMRRAHRHCSGLGARSIRSAIACRGVLPANRIALTSRAIGSSTPCRSPSATAVRAVVTPSATVLRLARISSSRRPCPSSTPSVRLRESAPVAVSTRSPRPASPAKVSGSAPMVTPRRVSSASPRVMRAARGL